MHTIRFKIMLDIVSQRCDTYVFFKLVIHFVCLTIGCFQNHHMRHISVTFTQDTINVKLETLILVESKVQ